MKFAVTIPMFAFGAAILAGCASTARSDHMAVTATPQQRMLITPLRNNVAVLEVSGGQVTDKLWASKVGTREFAGALALSLEDAKLLAAAPANARYTLSARLERLEQPLTGLDLTVTATVSYSLVEKSSGAEVLRRTHTLPYTAAFGDTLGSIDRVRVASEGALKANIAAVVDDLLALQLAPNGTAHAARR
jgi:hypothetical protein